MRTTSQELYVKVADRLSIPVEDVEKEVITYSKVLKKALNDKVQTDYDYYMLGKLKPRPTVMERVYLGILNAKKKLGDEYVTTPDIIKKIKFYNRWKEVITKGRWKIKGQHNPFKK